MSIISATYGRKEIDITIGAEPAHVPSNDLAQVMVSDPWPHHHCNLVVETTVFLTPFPLCTSRSQRLQYYLSSVTASCGLDAVQPDMIDYKNYRRLTRRRANQVFEAACVLSPDEFHR